MRILKNDSVGGGGIRKDMNIKAGVSAPIIYFVAAALSAAALIYFYTYAGTKDLKMLSRESYRLGTVVRITLYGENKEKMKKALDLAMEEIGRLEGLLSVNISSSDVSLVNEASGKFPVKVSEETACLLEKALDWSRLTNGAFDPTIGSIVRLWGIGTSRESVPSVEELEKALALTDYRKVSVLRKGKDFFVQAGEGQRIDLGGIAKGYVTDRVRELLLKNGITSAIIDLGGNIAVIGTPPKEAKWKIGLQNPFGQRGEYFGVTEATDLSVVTSGPYERYFESNGVRYHHIFDPATGYPSLSDLASVTVVSSNSTDADALSTALFVMGLQKSLSFLRAHKEANSVLVIRKSGIDKVYVTEGLLGNFILKDPSMKQERAGQ